MPIVNHSIDLSLGQSNQSSCWYAAYCMIYKWANRPTSQIRQRIEGAGLNYNDYWANGLPSSDYIKTRQVLGLSGFSRRYFRNTANDLEHMSEMVKSYGPFWCAMSNPAGSGDHAVVVNGVNPGLNRISVVNPWGAGGQAEQTYMTAIGFKNRMNGPDVFSGAQMWL